LLDDARDILTTPPQAPIQQIARYEVARGQLLSLDKRFNEAQPLLESGMRNLADEPLGEYFEACRTLASNFQMLGQHDRSVQTLEECTSPFPAYAAAPVPPYFQPSSWMRLRLDLADHYRAGGRASDAQAIEADIRHRLKYADPDSPLLLRVGAGPG
jgi:hypothetical protein